MGLFFFQDEKKSSEVLKKKKYAKIRARINFRVKAHHKIQEVCVCVCVRLRHWFVGTQRINTAG